MNTHDEPGQALAVAYAMVARMARPRLEMVGALFTDDGDVPFDDGQAGGRAAIAARIALLGRGIDSITPGHPGPWA